MITVLSVKNETEVGITIVHQHSFMEDMVMENRLNHTNVENIVVGNTIEKLNINKLCNHQWMI